MNDVPVPCDEFEPSLLSAADLHAWSGLRLGVYRAVSHEVRQHVTTEHAIVAAMLRGRSRTRMRSRGESVDLCPGPDHVGLFGPQLDLDYSCWDVTPGTERVMIEVDGGMLRELFDTPALLPQPRRLRQALTLRDPELARMLHAMASEARHGSPHGRLFASSLSLGLAAYLWTHHAEGGSAPGRERGGLTPAQRERVVALMQQRLGDDLDLGDLASAAGLSRFHFLRLFKRSFGQTPYRHLLEQRLATARTMLCDTPLPVAEVAAACGFSSQSHLSTALRRHCGVSPVELRRHAGLCRA